MGNAASVAPNENDVVKKEKKSKTRGRNKPVSTPAPRRRTTAVAAEQDAPAAEPEEGRLPQGSVIQSTTATKPSEVSSTQQRIDRAIGKVLESSRDTSVRGVGVHAGAEPQADDGGLGRANKENEQHGKPPEDTETDKPVSKAARKSWEGRAERPTANGTDEHADKHRSKESSASDSETSSNASYTSSSYTGSAETSDDEGSDDTFFVPEVSVILQVAR